MSDEATNGETRENSAAVIRYYRPEDRDAVRKICADTGFLGKPIDPVFEDRELFADYLTSYYTDVESDSAIILESEGVVRGYLLGSRFPDLQSRHEKMLLPKLFLRAMARYPFRYNKASRQFVRWLLWKGWREVPAKPPGKMAHFHINLEPEYKNVRGTKDLIDFFFAHLTACGEKAVYGQMVTFEKRRGERMFARYGFRVLDCVEVTKYKHLVDHQVFLFTVVKDLERNASLYGTDLWKENSKEKAGS